MTEMAAPDRIDDDRRRFLGAAAMTVAAFELGRSRMVSRVLGMAFKLVRVG